ncbi:MAG: hypothetical protein FJX76_28790 [Armatimonadetes bacterium]|nr:hypothetical protein [Armatimonadota bacterium]
MHELISELLEVTSSEMPIVSLYMDTRPGEAGRTQGRRHRGGFVWLKARLAEVAGLLPQRGKAHDSFRHDGERIHRFIEDELAPATQGLAIFACHARNLFIAHQFQLPFDNELVVDEVPYVYPLARLLDGHHAFAAVLADSEHARIYSVALGKKTEAVRFHHPVERASGPTAGRHSGAAAVGSGDAFGTSRLRFQRYLEGHVEHHLRNVVEHLERIITTDRLTRIVLGGSDAITAELLRLLPRHLQERVVDRVHLEPDTPENEVVRKTMRVLEDGMGRERARRVDWLCQEDLTEGLGVIGLGRTLRALNEGNVDAVIFSSGFDAQGFLCGACDQLQEYAAEGNHCRYCGAAGVKILTDLREAVTTRAERMGARVEEVDRHPILSGSGGVGAVLRFRHAPQAISVR